ncbi:MAG: UDP-N-acetylmuramoyl-L-alanyl-D-glutamate--2,6-diaminopimelate ligase [Lentisphaeria bacterium]|nr:UDP-N-acetylmuramoyl-L-alanyl-D-glutamate--2,6-diaminopimelate ligase [Lentisphaeria bacterium]
MDHSLPLCSEILKEQLISLRGKDVALPEEITADSRTLLPGGLFAAVPGTKSDGHDFIPLAEKKASVIIHSKELDHFLPEISYYHVRNAAACAALLFREKYGRPDEKLQLLGVTGTNGKTTTVFILEHLLKDCGLLSTIEFRTGKNSFPATHTTPDSATLFRLLDEMQRNGLRSAAMELSSHALDQDRARGARFKCAVFTNLTGDHLDYHKDMEHYYQAKKRFFTRLLHPEGTAVINTDDPWGRRLAEELHACCRIITFGQEKEADWQIRALHTACGGSRFDLVCGKICYPVRTNLAGKHNAFNLTGAFLAAMSTGVLPEQLLAALEKEITVPGRMQMIPVPGGPLFVVDFAHTDDALAHVLEVLRPLTAGRLFCVFGAGGDRDKSKRPRMGQAASCADHLIVTSDNPRSEEPEKIIADIVAGIRPGTLYDVEPDRKKAVQKAFRAAQPGDVVLVAGKGHENYQEIKGVRYAFSDVQIIQQCFKRENNEQTDA